MDPASWAWECPGPEAEAETETEQCRRRDDDGGLTRQKYLVSDQPGSSVSVKFRTSVGTVELFFLMSGTFGLGSVECWADEDKDRKVRLDGYYNLPAGVNIGVARVVRNDLSPGEHELHCVLSDETRDPGGGKEFRIISVMSV